MIEINPLGNVWDRLRAAYYLFRHPQEFIDGIIQEFIKRVTDHAMAAQAAYKAEPAQLTLPGLDKEVAVAAQEAMNG